MGDEEEAGGSDLGRTVQDALDEVDQLLHGADGLAGQEVLLVGGVEDDNGGHRHFPEGGGGDAGLNKTLGLASLHRNTLHTTQVNKAFGLKAAHFLPWGRSKGVLFSERATLGALVPLSRTASVLYANNAELRGSGVRRRSHLKRPLQIVADR